MTQELTFRIDFRGPFLVSTGSARTGVDATADPTVPLPTTALKGLLRAELFEALDIEADHIDPIFGSAGTDSCWWWSEPEMATRGTDDAFYVGSASRIRLTAEGVVEEGFLAIQDVVWADTATTTVVPAKHLDEATWSKHAVLLRAAARSVSALGSNRRRGHGWVRIADVDPKTGTSVPWTTQDSERLMQLRGKS